MSSKILLESFQVVRYEHTPNYPNEWASGTVEIENGGNLESGGKCNGDDVRN